MSPLVLSLFPWWPPPFFKKSIKYLYKIQPVCKHFHYGLLHFFFQFSFSETLQWNIFCKSYENVFSCNVCQILQVWCIHSRISSSHTLYNACWSVDFTHWMELQHIHFIRNAMTDRHNKVSERIVKKGGEQMLIKATSAISKQSNYPLGVKGPW